jgi:membrane protein DedA with SNARE-associated domain
MPFGRFVISVLLAASIWTTGLFYLSYLFGALTEQWLGWWRWPAILLAFLLPLYAVQKLVRAKTPEAGGGA